MPPLMSPQSQAGIQSFYDAQTRGPKLNPKLMIAIVLIFGLVIMILDHFFFGA